MRSTTADVAVIVSQAMPEQLTKFGQVEGIWVCSFGEVAALAYVLRDGIIKVSNANRSQENRGEKCTCYTITSPAMSLANSGKPSAKDSNP